MSAEEKVTNTNLRLYILQFAIENKEKNNRMENNFIY